MTDCPLKYSKVVTPLRIVESPVSLECREWSTLEIGRNRLIIGIVEPFAARYGTPGYSQIAPYAIMLLVLVLRPNGLFSQIQSKKV